jgi:hypothetical protein
METVNLNKKLYAKNQYERVIDTKFSQLANVTPPEVTEATISVDEFFQNYNQIFFQIPKVGEINSHEYLVKTSSEYLDSAPLNEDIQALIDEINTLQQQNLELNQRIIELSATMPSTSATGTPSISGIISEVRSTTETETEVQRATRGRG